ncbi:MAG TPA: MFS transporter [Lachnospiraceae bacterium]|nr:MFS transporter [Lachnospiraceae bacterium]
MKKFMILWAGEMISSIGSGLTAFGLGVYVYRQTGLASATALVSLLALLPAVLLGPVAGVLADRYDRRLLMVAGDSLSALGLLYILVSLINGRAELLQICIGVTVSSVFASLLEPSYRATITDLLPEEHYSKASGLVQLASSAKYLISPALAGLLMKFSGIRVILLIDICTFFITVQATLAVKKRIAAKEKKCRGRFMEQLREGFLIITKKRGIFLVILLSAGICFFLTFIQTLSTPMILAFSDEATLGICETICACGMLVSSLILGIVSIKKGYVKMLSLSMFFAGLFMMLFSLRENMIIVGIGGFLFFMAIPFANTGLDILIRTNIPNELQGRAWGTISLISQLGYVLANACIGVLADYLFEPAMRKGGILAGSIGKLIGTGTGRGTALLIMTGGLALCIIAVLIYRTKPIRELEKEHPVRICRNINEKIYIKKHFSV